jgi:hypothetical protein
MRSEMPRKKRQGGYRQVRRRLKGVVTSPRTSEEVVLLMRRQCPSDGSSCIELDSVEGLRLGGFSCPDR